MIHEAEFDTEPSSRGACPRQDILLGFCLNHHFGTWLGGRSAPQVHGQKQPAEPVAILFGL